MFNSKKTQLFEVPKNEKTSGQPFVKAATVAKVAQRGETRVLHVWPTRGDWLVVRVAASFWAPVVLVEAGAACWHGVLRCALPAHASCAQ